MTCTSRLNTSELIAWCLPQRTPPSLCAELSKLINSYSTGTALPSMKSFPLVKGQLTFNQLGKINVIKTDRRGQGIHIWIPLVKLWLFRRNRTRERREAHKKSGRGIREVFKHVSIYRKKTEHKVNQAKLGESRNRCEARENLFAEVSISCRPTSYVSNAKTKANHYWHCEATPENNIGLLSTLRWKPL